MFTFSWIAILVAAVAAFVLGFLFHGPIAGKLWMKLANIHPTGNEKLSDMYGQMLRNFLVNLIMAFVMAGLFVLIFSSSLMVSPVTWLCGATLGAWFWLGFLATSSYIEVIWMGRSWKLWLFEAVCSLISTAVMGAILAAW